MFTEIASITIDPARAAEFEAAVAEAAPHFRAAAGCHGMALERVVEEPAHYRLIVRWATVEDHVVHFRNSEGFTRWRALAGPYFAAPPAVIHSAEVARFF
ncbi:MAG: antibiotic biosynthesis monooxygenase [Sphingomonas fennica]